MKRINLTHFDTYVLDPPNCTDADDAFCINEEDNKTILWVFIADPTDGFEYGDDTYNTIINKVFTRYYLDKPPDHLFPESFVQAYSLHDGVKPAIGVKVVFDERMEILSHQIELVLICAKKRLDYHTAVLDTTLEKGLVISDTLFKNRTGIGKLLSEHPLAIPRFVDNKWVLEMDSELAVKLKNMIAEFAIMTNKIVAKELSAFGTLLTKSCDDVSGLANATHKTLLTEIVRNGVYAQYSLSNTRHLLIDNSVYTHFTSPLRRACDCLVHFLLKAKLKGAVPSITPEDLTDAVTKFNTVSKADRKRQYKETKRAVLLAIENMQKPIKVELQLTSNVPPFLNMMMTRVNDYPVHVSITLKGKVWKGSDTVVVDITEVHAFQRYDNEVFPELAEMLNLKQ